MGGSSKKQTVGYKYYMGVQLALTHGPVDSVLELIAGERSAWTGDVTESTTIRVDAPHLFGGEKREGGLQGSVDIMMGEVDQGVNPYLESRIDGPVPAFRGLVTTVFRASSYGDFKDWGPLLPGGAVGGWLSGLWGGGSGGFYWSAMNPYFKPPWWRIRRVLKGWSRNVTWYPEKARIGRDMNAIHIVYECLTNIEWGMGYSPDDMDDPVWRAAADKIFDEDFGLSLLWMEQTTIIDFVQLILQHINASIRVSIKTGRFQIRLLRNDYVAETLPELNPSNVLQLVSFQRTAWGDGANEVVVKYTDRDQIEATVAVQNLAAIESQGSLISTTKEFVGIRDPDLARRVASRELELVSTPLAKLSLVVNRVAWDWDVTDVFRFSWPKLGIDGVVFRILKINKGDLINGQIKIEAIEDIFGMPENSYVGQQPSGWVDPISDPKPAIAVRAMETPYWDIATTATAADLAYLPDDAAYGQVLAVSPTDDTYGYDLWASSNNVTYDYVAAGQFTPTAIITNAIPRAAGVVNLAITNPVDLDLVELGSYAYIDNEAFVITGQDPETGNLIAGRAVLDTVPTEHVAGSRIYFADSNAGYDPTQRVQGETTYYKPLTRTGKGTLQLSESPAASITFTGRMDRPYPPGNVRINGAYFPTKVYGPLSVTWAHRDRLQQTAALVPFTTGNVGPEPGTTYTVRTYRGDTLKKTFAGITGTTWGYETVDEVQDEYIQLLRIQLESVRDGKVSWQRHDITIDRHGLGFHLGEELGGVAP